MSLPNDIVDANTMLGIHPEHRLDMSVASLVAQMQKNNISDSLVISTVGVYHSFQSGNVLTMNAAADDKHLLPVATVNPRNYFTVKSDFQAMKDQGFRIFKFFPSVQNWRIDSCVFRRILNELAAVKMPIMIETMRSGDIEHVSRIAGEYPCKIILCSISVNMLSEVMVLMEEFHNVCIQTDDLHVTGGLEFLRSRIGADRIVYGSGAPRRSIPSSLCYIENSELAEEEKALILAGNIRRILEEC